MNPVYPKSPRFESEIPHTDAMKNRAQGPVFWGNSLRLGRSDAAQPDTPEGAAGEERGAGARRRVLGLPAAYRGGIQLPGDGQEALAPGGETVGGETAFHGCNVGLSKHRCPWRIAQCEP